MDKKFYEFQKELIVELEAAMEDAAYQLITKEEYQEYLHMEKQAAECSNYKELLQIAQAYYRSCLLRCTNSADSYVNRKATEYYLRKLKEVRRELYV